MRSVAFVTDEEGGVTVVTALLIPLILLVAALTLETSHLYVEKLQTQRAADIANLAAASTPSPISGTTASPAAKATAANLAEINGFKVAKVETTTAVSPGAKERMALVTTIVDDAPLHLGKLLTDDATMAVAGVSWAEIGGTPAGDCLRSLLGPTNIYGNAVVSGPTCTIGAATFLYVCGSAAVKASRVEVDYTAAAEKPYICSTSSIDPPLQAFNFETPSTDMLAGTPQIQAIRARLQRMGNPGWPYGTVSPETLLDPPTPGAASSTFSNQTATLDRAARYGELTVSNSRLTFSGKGGSGTRCSSPTTISGDVKLSGKSKIVFESGCYAFGGDIVAAAGAQVSFEVEKGAKVTLAFKGSIINGSGTLGIADATISVMGTIDNTKGGNLVFGNGKIVFGAGTNNGTGALTFGNGPFYVNGGTITNGTGTLTFGDGPFYLWGGSMSNASNGALVFGDGPFYFYGGTVTNVKGTMTFGNGPFEFQGGTLSLNANSDTTFGVGDVNFYGGSISLGGDSVTFGSGGSAVTGGSSVFLYGGTLSLTTRNLNAIGTTIAHHGGTINLLGVGAINATAPTSQNPEFGYQNVLFVVYGGAFNLYQSAAVTDTMSGIIYVPSSNASIYGSQTVRYPEGGCFQIVSGVLDIYQKADIATAPCHGVSTTSAGSVVLVQ